MQKDKIERVARWLRLRDWRNGQMVDEYGAEARYWRTEAKKIIRIVEAKA